VPQVHAAHSPGVAAGLLAVIVRERKPGCKSGACIVGSSGYGGQGLGSIEEKPVKRSLVVICLLALAGAARVGCAGASEPQDVSFVATCDGSTQRYVLVLPEGFVEAEPHHVLIALHGHGSDRWQFVRNARDECRAARDVAAEHRMLFVSPDYRAKTSWMGPAAEADLVQIIAMLKRRYRVGKVVVCGGSMGGAACLTFAALHPELVDGVASMNGTANHLEYEQFQEAISASFGGTKQEIPAEYKRRSAEFWPQRFTMPVGITAGGRDRLVPPQSVLRLAAALEKLRREVLVVYREEGGHSTGYADAVAILRFAVERAIGGDKPKPAEAGAADSTPRHRDSLDKAPSGR